MRENYNQLNKLNEWITETKGKIRILESFANLCDCKSCKESINQKWLPLLSKELLEYENCLAKIA